MNRRRLGNTRSRGFAVGGIALLVGLAVVALAVGSRIPRGTAVQSTRADARPMPTGLTTHVPEVRAAYEHLPLIFEKNQGQTDGRVRFVARGDGYGLFLTSQEAVLALRHASRGKRDFSVVRMKLAGANPRFEVGGERQLPGKSNYFIGNDPAKWQRNVPQFAGVRYRDVYPGIDLVYHGNQGKLEYDFEIAPGAEPARVAMEFEGSRPRLSPDGDLMLSLPGGDVAMQAPRAYQKVADREHIVPSRFVLRNGEVGFEVGDYDRSRTLVIDPILSYSTYLGGSGNEACTLILGTSTPISGCPAVAVDQASNAYIAGSTESTDFPIPAGGTPFQSTLKGTANVFVAKFNSTGSTEEFATYIGGSGVDTTAGIAVDLAFNVVVTGNTSSSNFPTKNAFQASPLNTTNKHIFVSKLDPTGSTLLYSTYLSGLGVDVATGVALDPGGNAYVTGTTTSTEVSTGFPSTTGSFQTAPASGSTIQFFLTKVNPNVAGVASVPYSTYFGGGNSLNTGPAAVGGGVAVDVDSNVYITGGTSFLHVGLSNDFPILNAYQGCLDQAGSTSDCSTTVSAYDIFVAKLNPTAITGTQLLYSTYVGAAGDDIGYGVAVDSSLNVYVTGSTSSNPFVVAGTGVFQSTYGGGASDAFMVKLGPPTTTGNLQGYVPLLYSTYIGGGGTDVGLGITVDTIQGARLTGWTNSGETINGVTTTPLLVLNNPVQAVYGGGAGDAFVARIDTTTTIQNAAGHYLTYLGGSGADYGTGIAVDPQGASYVAGETQSPAPSFPLAAPFQSMLDGSSDAFLSKLGPILSLGVTVTAAPTPVGVGNQATFTYTITNNGDATNNVTFTDFLPPTGASFVSATSSPGTCGSASGGLVLCNVGTMNSNATATETVILIPNAPTTPAGNPVPLTNNGSAGIGGSNQFNAPPATVTVNDYTLTVSPAQATTPAGVPANFTATLTPTGAIPNSVSIACSGLPTGATCVETTNPIPNLNQGPASTALVINTTMRVTTTTELLRRGVLYAVLLPIGGLTFLGVGIGSGSKKRRALMGLLLGCFFGLVLLQAGCGSSSTTNTTGTPAGTYVVTITASSNEASRSTTVNLVVQ
ncbi:MAG TPA: SBBP repeat-containing protein [Terriglobales bacterium]|nr:SBBP repeat-containing protein [Terriglobales bacterium]